MKTKKHKKILGLFILLAAVAFISPRAIYADEGTVLEGEMGTEELKANTTKNCDSFKSKSLSNYVSKYGITFKEDKSDPTKLVISMNIPDKSNLSKEDIKKAKFKIAKIEVGRIADGDKKKIYDTYNENQLVNQFSPSAATLSNKGKIVLKNPYDMPRGIHVYLSAVDYNDKELVNNCGKDALLGLITSIDVAGAPKINEVSLTEDQKNMVAELSKVSGKQLIDCSTVDVNGTSFESKYCYALNKSKENKDVSYPINLSKKGTGAVGFTDKDVNSFKCDYNTMINSQELLDNDAKYYVNQKYMSATESHDKDVGEYKYCYAKDKKGNCTKEVKEKISCTITCTEAVSVEYGAPVASKAGLCFQYKVKVTSHTNCGLTKEPNQPNTKPTVCTPTPGCNHGSGYVDTAAGPNGAFKECVNKCDGGKYTSKCSHKCYKKVYGKSSNKTSVSEVSIKGIKLADRGNQTIDAATLNNVGVGHYRFVNNKIIWDSNTLARFYAETGDRNDQWDWGCLKDENQGGGILAACGCEAQCRWNGCVDKDGKPSTYLNKDDADQDIKDNLERYKVAVENCVAGTTCSTEAAEFEISVDYKYGTESNEHKTIYFPYTKSGEETKVKLKSAGNEKTTCENPGGDKARTLIDAQGCYANPHCTIKENEGKYTPNALDNYYLTEWTFPGTWEHVKTGEITYSKPDGDNKDNAWISRGNKYCIPLDQVEVNKKWWDSYYNNLVTKSNAKDDYTTGNVPYLESIEACNKDEVSSTNINKATTLTDNDIDYNIHASTKKFGYFHWNINIDCFFATGIVPATGNKTTGTTTNNSDSCLNPSKEQMKVRTVDLGNLFPGKGEEAISEPYQTGRAPGFNWTRFSEPTFNGTTEGDNSYSSQIHPQDYLSWVQEKKYTVYDDSELDYEILLTKDNIRELRKRGENYTKFDGTTDKIDSAAHYRSKLLKRGNTSPVVVNQAPEDAARDCNNIIDRSKCFDPVKDR